MSPLPLDQFPVTLAFAFVRVLFIFACVGHVAKAAL
jgi:hypothetical protein